ncbi:hypothetical protein GA0070558_14031 [Micromonospora haikouensis]|uniref:Uncharacterized protein n=1 Tax=Micromonospora haikouensis TaxID=686309 RepID=A0A1C4YC75_9ACTN|nr:hypothetical protein [Micromonospora haikouensis]SCF18329.1 hypothetical protein GA0070558_14031 [Micromonospora haikouensis]
MADEIRHALTRLAEPVMPSPDPYQRLLVRVRRRRQRRITVAGVAGLTAAALALPAFGAAGRLVTGVASSPPATGTYQPASRIETPLVRQLLDSPTRGNLAGDGALIADIQRQYRTARARLLVDPALGEVKVLLAHDAPGGRIVVVAFLGDSHALLRSAIAQVGASVPDLLSKTGTPDAPLPLEPYAFLSRLSPTDGGHVADVTVGLAPAGCLVETSGDGRLQPDGSIARSWQVASTDGLAVGGAGPVTERWRFTCQGVVRYSGPAGGGPGVVLSTKAAAPVSTAGARGSVDAALAAVAVRDLRELAEGQGLTGPAPKVVWGGRLPDWVSAAPEAVLVNSCSTDGGCAALLKIAAGPQPPREASAPTGYRTAVGRPDLTVVPVPGETAGVLVVGPETATRVELLDKSGRTIADGQLAAGAGALRVDPRQVVGAKVFDAAGRLLLTGATPNLGTSSDQFGEPTVWAW